MNMLDAAKGIKTRNQHSNCMRVTKPPPGFFVVLLPYYVLLSLNSYISLPSFFLPSASTSFIPINNRLKCGLKMYPGRSSNLALSDLQVSHA